METLFPLRIVRGDTVPSKNSGDTVPSKAAFTLERFQEKRAICYRFGCSFTLIQRKRVGKTITSESGSQSGYFENGVMECRRSPRVNRKNNFKMATYLSVTSLLHVSLIFQDGRVCSGDPAVVQFEFTCRLPAESLPHVGHGIYVLKRKTDVPRLPELTQLVRSEETSGSF